MRDPRPLVRPGVLCLVLEVSVSVFLEVAEVIEVALEMITITVMTMADGAEVAEASDVEVEDVAEGTEEISVKIQDFTCIPTAITSTFIGTTGSDTEAMTMDMAGSAAVDLEALLEIAAIDSATNLWGILSFLPLTP